MGDQQMAMQARLMSQALRKITGAISKSKTCVIFINQLRMKIGVMFGNPETTTGGNALKFYASVRLDIRRIQTLKKGEQPIGSRTRVKVVKNKISPPFKQAEFDIIFGTGINQMGEVLDIASESEIVEKQGTWYTYGSEKMGQGREQASDFLKANPKIFSDIHKKILTHYGIQQLKCSTQIKKEIPKIKSS